MSDLSDGTSAARADDEPGALDREDTSRPLQRPIDSYDARVRKSAIDNWSRAIYAVGCAAVAYSVVGAAVAVYHLRRMGPFDPRFDNAPIFLYGLVGVPVALVAIALGPRGASADRPPSVGADDLRCTARLAGLVSLSIAAAVVMFFVVLNALGLPDHPFA